MPVPQKGPVIGKTAKIPAVLPEAEFETHWRGHRAGKVHIELIALDADPDT